MADAIISIDGRDFAKLACGHCGGSGTCPHGNECAECRGAHQNEAIKRMGGGLWAQWCASIVDVDAKYKCQVCDGDGYKLKRIE